MGAPTRYDIIRYPSNLYQTTLPDHLAALATLHGIDAPDPATARVLEVAGGDGVNLIGMAVAYPHASFHSFDLSRVAVARGQALAAAAGLSNVRIEVADILDAAERMEGPYDYVIVHGLYAWVPEIVRAATLKLIGRVLAPNGMAIISYNAYPGCHLRMAIRDMLLEAVRGIADPDARDARAREVLADFAQPGDGDTPPLAGLRDVARPMLRTSPGLLHHDILGEVYAPQHLREVVAAAAPHGLAFLTDAMPSLVFDGLPGPSIDEATVVGLAQQSDYRALAFFHQTLFVRAGRAPLRHIDPSRLAGLFASTRLRETAPNHFESGSLAFDVEDARFADFLRSLIEAAPGRCALAPIAQSVDACRALLELYRQECVRLHVCQHPGVLVPGTHPTASPLARAQIALDEPIVFSLDHQMVRFGDAAPRAFVALLDGTRDRAALEADWAASAFGGQVAAGDALHQIARAGLLVC